MIQKYEKVRQENLIYKFQDTKSIQATYIKVIKLAARVLWDIS